jgi:hypothetical protein
MNIQKIASHTVAVVIGLVIASCTRSPRVEIVEKVVHHHTEVPVEKIVEKVVEKIVVKTKTEVVVKEMCPLIIEQIFRDISPKAKKHRISAMFGVGPRGLRVKSLANGSEVSTDYDLVGGLGYSYKTDRKFSVGVQALTNYTFLGTLGLDY